MKRKTILYSAIVIIVITGYVYACKSKDEKTADPAAETKALIKSENTDSLSTAIANLLHNYYAMKDNFIKENDSAINQYARLVAATADNLPLSAMKADELIITTAKTNAQGIVAEVQGILIEKSIEEKRKGLSTLSEQLYDLLRTVQYNKEAVYHYLCDAAMNGNGASWLSMETTTQNPYLPKQKSVCATLSDSLDFRKK